MIIKFESIEHKDCISKDEIVEAAIRIGHRVLSAEIPADFLKDSKIKVQKLKKHSSTNYFCTMLLSLVKSDEASSYISFDLTVYETRKNYLDSRIEEAWQHLVSQLKAKVEYTNE